MSHRTAFSFALAAVLLLLSHGRTKTAPDPADPLTELNDGSRAAYRRAREEAVARTGPVVLVEGDDLVLKYGQQRLVARTTPDEYHVLKTISHVPLAIHALLASRDQLDDQRVFDVKVYRERIAAIGPVLARRGLSDEQLARQRKILTESDQLLSRVVEKRAVTKADLQAFYKVMRPEIDANTTDAAQAQIDGLNKQMVAWKAKLTEKEWSQLTVVVMGSQMPRRDNLAVQYFARLLGETGESRRIIYAEALFDETKALDLLGTHLVDTGIGEAFFADPQRMHRDLLADAARTYLDKMFKQAP